MDSLFSLKSISKYRAELMGFAIIGVLIGHIISFGDLDYPIIDGIAHGIHTPGFLFLSGFGLYYSFLKDHSTKQFYIRRFWRFYFPYVLIYLPFLCRSLFTGNFHVISFIERITTLNFWLHGNNDGMWYIAVQFILYLITPLFFLLIAKKEKYTAAIIGGGILSCVLINYIIQALDEGYWDMVSIGLKHSHMFFWGLLFSYLSMRKIDNTIMSVTIGVVSVLYILMLCFKIDIMYVSTLLSTLFYIVVVCVILELLDKISFLLIKVVFKWFGKYTLELYLLHIFVWAYLFSPVFRISNELVRISVAVLISISICAPTQFVVTKIKNLLQHQ